MLEEIERLKQELAATKEEGLSNNNAATILSGFISKGKAKFREDGNVVLVDEEDEGNFVQLEQEDLMWESLFRSEPTVLPPEVVAK